MALPANLPPFPAPPVQQPAVALSDPKVLADYLTDMAVWQRKVAAWAAQLVAALS